MTANVTIQLSDKSMKRLAELTKMTNNSQGAVLTQALQLYELVVRQEIMGGVQFFAQRPFEATPQRTTFLIGDIDK